MTDAGAARARSFSDKWSRNPSLAFKQTLDESSEISGWILTRNGFDFIYCQEVLHHIGDPQTALENLASLRPAAVRSRSTSIDARPPPSSPTTTCGSSSAACRTSWR